MKVKIFYSYSHKDEELKEKFITHMYMLSRLGLIEEWHDRKILPGQNWEVTISQHIKTADIVIFLISADFLASDFCYNNEVLVSLERHQKGECVVVPILLKSCVWQDAPFGHIQGLPNNMFPVISKHWFNEDEAFVDIVNGLKKVINDYRFKRTKLIIQPYEIMVNSTIWR